MRSTLRTRLMAAFGLIAALAILCVSLAANLFLESRFTALVESRIAAERQALIASLEASWAQGGVWDHDALTEIGMGALSKGFIIRLEGAGGQDIWDARTHNNGLCEQMMRSVAATMDKRYASWEGQYREMPYPLASGGQALGRVWIGDYGPFWLSDSELYFLSSLNQMILLCALVALALALVLGWLMARRMSRPIQEVSATAGRLRAGELGARSTVSTGISEIAALAAAIDGLGQTLGEQEALRRRLTGDISHELRTPLTTLRSHIEALIDGIWSPSPERLQGLKEEVERLTRLVAQLEGLAAAESGAAAPAWQELALKPFVERLGGLHADLFRAAGVAFDWNAAELSFPSDPDRLSQILGNLLSNAAKYTPPGGRVSLEAGCEGAGPSRRLVFSVRDNGSGIPPGDLPHIFERFYRVDPSRASRSGGAGIGLTIALSLARQLGGSLQAESRLGEGSVFRLSLPAPAEPDRP